MQKKVEKSKNYVKAGNSHLLEAAASRSTLLTLVRGKISVGESSSGVAGHRSMKRREDGQSSEVSGSGVSGSEVPRSRVSSSDPRRDNRQQ